MYVGCQTYAGRSGGVLLCLDSQGAAVWTAELPGVVSWSAASIGDLSGDGCFEVVQGDQSKHISAFDADSGALIWQTEMPGELDASLALADLDGDGSLEVVAPCSSGHVVALDADGSLRWQTKIAEQVYSAPLVFTHSGGSKRVFCGSGDALVACLDADGNLLWKRPIDSTTDASLSAGDIDGDGRADLFTVTQRGQIWRFDEDGYPLWQLLMGVRCDAPGAIADVNGDGILEYVLCTHTGRLLVLDPEARVLLDTQLTQSAYNATPAVGSVMKPGSRELVIAGGSTGLLFCLGTPAGADDPVEWGSFRADQRMTGEWKGRAALCPVSVAPPGNLTASALLSSARSLPFTVTASAEAAKQGLQVTVGCLQPDGLRSVVTAPLASKETVVNLPLSLFTPGSYRFYWTVEGPGGGQVTAGSRDLNIQPFANDLRLLDSAQRRLAEAATSVEPVLPLSAQALRDALPGLRDKTERARGLAQSLPDVPMEERGLLVEEIAACVAEAQRLARIADLIKQVLPLGQTTSLLLSVPPLWDGFGVATRCPDLPQTQISLQRRLAPDEHVPLALDVFNITNRALQVQFVVETSEPGPTVKLMHPLPVPAGDGSAVWDAMPELDESRVITMPPLRTEQLWLDINAAGLAPGDYEVTVRCLALNGAGVHEAPTAYYLAVPPPVSKATIALRVLDFRMAPPEAFRHCNWAYVKNSLLRAYPETTYQDLLDHGTNVFVIGSGPIAKYDEQGRIVGDIDFSALDEDISRFRGKNVMFLLQGMTDYFTPVTGPKSHSDPAYKKALAPFLDALVRHMAELGFSTDNFAYYPFDEPGSDGWPTVNIYIEKAKAVREADPRILLYVDGGPPSLEMHQAMLPYVDIWQSYLHRVWNDFDNQRVALMRKYVKQVWTYAMDVDGKTLDLVDYYLADPIYCFVHGLTGNGYWTYCAQGQDPWQRGTEEYIMVYPGTTKPVTTRRWESVREGIEIYRTLAALRSLVEQAEAQGLAGDTCAAARRLLDQELPARTQLAPLTEDYFDSLRAQALTLGQTLTQALR